MHSVWQQLSLSNWSGSSWRSGSYLSRLLVGSLATWRQGSWFIEWSEPLGALLCSLVFILAPFVSNSLTGVLLIACGIYWFLLTVADKDKVGFTPIHLLVLLYWQVALLSTAMSPVKKAAFSGFTKLTLYLLLFALMARVLRSPRLRSILIAVYLHISLIVSTYGIRQWFAGVQDLATWTDPSSASAGLTRVYSYLGNPNLLAGYLLAAVAFSIVAVFAWRRLLPKLLAVTAIVVNSLCLILTFSRGGWIGFVVASFALLLFLVYWWTPKLPQAWRPWAMPAVLGGSAALLILAILLVEPVQVRVASIFAGGKDSSNNFRIQVWQSMPKMIADRPIFGIGPGNKAFKIMATPYLPVRFDSALGAYSVLLETAVEIGIVGLLAFLWLIVVTVNQGFAQLKRLRNLASPEGYWLMAAIATILGMMAHGVVDTVWYRPEVNTIWWFAVAIVASYYES